MRSPYLLYFYFSYMMISTIPFENDKEFQEFLIDKSLDDCIYLIIVLIISTTIWFVQTIIYVIKNYTIKTFCIMLYSQILKVCKNVIIFIIEKLTRVITNFIKFILKIYLYIQRFILFILKYIKIYFQILPCLINYIIYLYKIFIQIIQRIPDLLRSIYQIFTNLTLFKIKFNLLIQILIKNVLEIKQFIITILNWLFFISQLIYTEEFLLAKRRFLRRRREIKEEQKIYLDKKLKPFRYIKKIFLSLLDFIYNITEKIRQFFKSLKTKIFNIPEKIRQFFKSKKN